MRKGDIIRIDRALLLLLLLLFGSCTTVQKTEPLGTLYHNGTIYTMDSQSNIYTSMLIRDGNIVALGNESLVDSLSAENHEKIDLEGDFVFPGLIEGHGHFSSLGEVVCGLDLSGLSGWNEVLEKTKKYTQSLADTGWVIGKGWHPNDWSNLPEQTIEGYPVNKSLSNLFPDRPVVLQHSSYHALIANEKAMEIAGIDESTLDPEGGRILRDNQGVATGILEENAMGRVMGAYRAWKNKQTPEEQSELLNQYLDSASQRCLSYGITTFVDAGISVADFHHYRKYQKSSGLDLRIWAMASGQSLLSGGFGGQLPYVSTDQRFFIRAVKAFVDGALGSNGAWMKESYVDQPSWKGQNVTDLEVLKTIGQQCIEQGLQYCVHAIGDRGNHEVLNIYEQLFNENDQDGKALRWRIEHAQIVRPKEIQRFYNLGVIPSMQGIHCPSDAIMVVPKIGEDLARKGAYAWRSFLTSGSVIANGTDAPVESVNPFENLYASVTRTKKPGDVAFFPAQVMNREEAIRSLTIWNAYACQLDDQTGSLEVGKWADFIRLDTDLMKCEADEILHAKVNQTYVAGEKVYDR